MLVRASGRGEVVVGRYPSMLRLRRRSRRRAWAGCGTHIGVWFIMCFGWGFSFQQRRHASFGCPVRLLLVLVQVRDVVAEVGVEVGKQDLDHLPLLRIHFG